MGKDLSEMILEELWELIFIFLVAHDDRWKDRFNEIALMQGGRLKCRRSHLQKEMNSI